MFRDLVAMSVCKGDNLKSSNLKNLVEDENDFIEPSGFIFHESRVRVDDCR